MSKSTGDRRRRESAFHDHAVDHDVRSSAWKYYRVRASGRRYAQLLDEIPAAAEVLELGCGKQSRAVALGRRGVRVVGIDISPRSVELAVSRLPEESRPHVTLQVMDAEALTFPNRTFDVCCGSSILHHLDVEAAYREIARVLKPGGRAFFHEALGSNPLINVYRRLTPAMRTRDEHPLLPKDLTVAGTYFDHVRVSYFDFLTLLAVPIQRFRSTPGLVTWLQRADRWLFDRFPAARRLAWIAVIELAEPKSG